MRTSTILAVTMALSWPTALADETENDEPETVWEQALSNELASGKAEDFKIDSSMPDYPALAILGEDTAITNVTTPEDLSSTLFQQFDEDGDLKLGFAIGGQPYWLLNQPRRTFQSYKEASKLSRILFRTHASFAIVELNEGETVGDNTGFRTALGFSTEVLDSADPRFDVADRKCINDATENAIVSSGGIFDIEQAAHFSVVETIMKGIANGDQAYAKYDGIPLKLKPDDPTRIGTVRFDNLDAIQDAGFASEFDQMVDAEADLSKVEAGIEKALKDCADSAAQRLQGQKSLRLGAAIAARSDTGDTGDAEEDGYAFWASYRNPFGNAEDGTLSSWGAFAKYETDATEAVEMSEMMGMDDGMMTETEEDMMLAKYDGWRAGLNVNRVKGDFVVSGALSYVDKDFKSDMMPDEDYILATLTASMKVRDGLWAEASFGWADDAEFDAQEFAGIRLKADWGKLGLN